MTDEPQYGIHADWLVQLLDGCTCDGQPYGHMPECGMEPIASLDEVFEALRERAERVIAEEVAVRAPEVLYLPGGADAVDDPVHRAAIAAAVERAGGAGVLIMPMITTTPSPESEEF